MSKIEAFWKDATAEDVARVMAGETVEARFRDPPGGWGDWVLRAVDNSTLFIAGWKDGEWFDHEGDNWTQCQVYDPPQWWLDKPDPGPGLRLLEKFPDEEPLLGDSVFCPGSEIWLELEAPFDPGQRHGLWYRRRIEPMEPEPKHYVLRVGDSVETPAGHKFKVISRTETREVYALMAGDGVVLPNGQTITITAKGFEVTQ